MSYLPDEDEDYVSHNAYNNGGSSDNWDKIEDKSKKRGRAQREAQESNKKQKLLREAEIYNREFQSPSQLQTPNQSAPDQNARVLAQQYRPSQLVASSQNGGPMMPGSSHQAPFQPNQHDIAHFQPIIEALQRENHYLKRDITNSRLESVAAAENGREWRKKYEERGHELEKAARDLLVSTDEKYYLSRRISSDKEEHNAELARRDAKFAELNQVNDALEKQRNEAQLRYQKSEQEKYNLLAPQQQVIREKEGIIEGNLVKIGELENAAESLRKMVQERDDTIASQEKANAYYPIEIAEYKRVNTELRKERNERNAELKAVPRKLEEACNIVRKQCFADHERLMEAQRQNLQSTLNCQPQIDSLQQQLSKAHVDRDAALLQVQELDAKSSGHKCPVIDTTETLQKLSALEESLAKKSKALAEESKTLSFVRNRNSELVAEATAFRNIAAQRADTIKSLNAEIEDLKAKPTNTESSSTELERLRVELAETKVSVTNKKADLKAKFVTAKSAMKVKLENEKLDMIAKFNQQKADMHANFGNEQAAMQANFDNEKASMQSKFGKDKFDLRTQFESENVDAMALTAELHILKSQSADKETNFAAEKIRMESVVNGLLSKAQEDASIAQRDIYRLEVVATTLRSTITTLSSQLETTQAQLEQEWKFGEEIGVALKDAISKVATPAYFEIDGRNISDYIPFSAIEISRAQATITKLTKDLATANTEGLHKEIAHLKALIPYLEAQIHLKEGTNEYFMNRNQHLVQQLQEHKKEFSELGDSIGKLRGQYSGRIYKLSTMIPSGSFSIETWERDIRTKTARLRAKYVADLAKCHEELDMAEDDEYEKELLRKAHELGVFGGANHPKDATTTPSEPGSSSNSEARSVPPFEARAQRRKAKATPSPSPPTSETGPKVRWAEPVVNEQFVPADFTPRSLAPAPIRASNPIAQDPQAPTPERIFGILGEGTVPRLPRPVPRRVFIAPRAVPSPPAATDPEPVQVPIVEDLPVQKESQAVAEAPKVRRTMPGSFDDQEDFNIAEIEPMPSSWPSRVPLLKWILRKW